MNKEHLITRLGQIAQDMQTNRNLFSQHVDFMEKLNVAFHALRGAKEECEKLLGSIQELVDPPKKPANDEQQPNDAA